MGVKVGGVIGLIVLFADVWAIMQIVGSPTTTGRKAIWTVLILVFPVLGLLIWFAAGPRSLKNRS